MSIGAGLAAFGMGGVVAIASAIGGHLAAATPRIATMALIGLGMMAYGAFPLPAWARRRGQQMDEITTELTRPEDEHDR